MAVADILETVQEPIPQGEQSLAVVERLVAELEPKEVNYAWFMAKLGKGNTLSTEFLRREMIREIVGLAPSSNVANKPQVKQLIDCLRSEDATEVGITSMISTMMEMGMYQGIKILIDMMKDEDIDPKLRYNIIVQFLDRDPDSRTLKQKVQINQNSTNRNEGWEAFKDVCARKRISGTAVERRLEFHADSQPEGGASCQTSLE